MESGLFSPLCLGTSLLILILHPRRDSHTRAGVTTKPTFTGGGGGGEKKLFVSLNMRGERRRENDIVVISLSTRHTCSLSPVSSKSLTFTAGKMRRQNSSQYPLFLGESPSLPCPMRLWHGWWSDLPNQLSPDGEGEEEKGRILSTHPLAEIPTVHTHGRTREDPMRTTANVLRFSFHRSQEQVQRPAADENMWNKKYFLLLHYDFRMSHDHPRGRRVRVPKLFFLKTQSQNTLAFHLKSKVEFKMT